MENLYFEAMEKYAPALRQLYPYQLQAIAEALDYYTETGKILRLDDCFARMAFLMIICDDRYNRRKAPVTGQAVKEEAAEEAQPTE